MTPLLVVVCGHSLAGCAAAGAGCCACTAGISVTGSDSSEASARTQAEVV